MNIVITGASKGIGYYTAFGLAKNSSYRIFALSRDGKKLNDLAAEPGVNGNIIPIPCDLVSEKSVSDCIQKISGETDRIEVLINNAGYLINKPFEELTISDWQSVYNVNVFGLVNLTRSLLPLLRKGKLSSTNPAHIVNITSMGGVQGSMKFKGLSSYSSSKGALITVTECLSEELRGTGINVNCVALGSVDTEMFKQAFPGLKAASEVHDTATWLAEFALNGYKFFNGKTIPLSTTTP